MNSITELIKSADIWLFLKLNGWHNEAFDRVMYFISHKLSWIPLYIYFLYHVIKFFKKNSWKVLLIVILMIIISDQSSVHLFKEVFLRYRPCHHLLLKEKVHLINGHCGGLYGFVSSHAANTFALATFLYLLFRRASITFAAKNFLIVLWVILVGYSRIYSGVHYPLDIAGGWALGTVIGLAAFEAYNKFIAVKKP